MKRVGLAVGLLLVAACLSGCGNRDKRLNGRWEGDSWIGETHLGTVSMSFNRGKCTMNWPEFGAGSFRYDASVSSSGPSQMSFNLRYVPCHGVYRFEGENNEKLFFHYCIAYDDCRHIGDQADTVLNPETSWSVFVLDKTANKSGLESARDVLSGLYDGVSSVF